MAETEIIATDGNRTVVNRFLNYLTPLTFLNLIPLGIPLGLLQEPARNLNFVKRRNWNLFRGSFKGERLGLSLRGLHKTKIKSTDSDIFSKITKKKMACISSYYLQIRTIKIYNYRSLNLLLLTGAHAFLFLRVPYSFESGPEYVIIYHPTLLE